MTQRFAERKDLHTNAQSSNMGHALLFIYFISNTETSNLIVPPSHIAEFTDSFDISLLLKGNVWTTYRIVRFPCHVPNFWGHAYTFQAFYWQNFQIHQSYYRLILLKNNPNNFVFCPIFHLTSWSMLLWTYFRHTLRDVGINRDI